MEARQTVLASRPLGYPSPANFRTETISLRELNDGELLLKAWYISVDPYMRGRMSNIKSYAASYEIDQPVMGGVVAKVIESRSSSFSPGDSVVGTLPWATYCIANSTNIRKVDTVSFPPGYYLGILGMPGLTAYIGMMDIGRPQQNERVVISGAAGAVGLAAGQIAKILGADVTGIAGSDEKCNLLTEKFGFDRAINYKSSKNLRKEIALACPGGVDVYFDNVGGEITDSVVSNLNFHSRFVLCGQISQYNNTRISTGPSILPILLTRSVTLKGFIVSNYSGRFDEAAKELSMWVRDGRLKYTETIIEGFDRLPEAFIGLFSGVNQGKLMVKID